MVFRWTGLESNRPCSFKTVFENVSVFSKVSLCMPIHLCSLCYCVLQVDEITMRPVQMDQILICNLFLRNTYRQNYSSVSGNAISIHARIRDLWVQTPSTTSYDRLLRCITWYSFTWHRNTLLCITWHHILQ